MIYNVITIACLALMLVAFLVVVINVAVKKRADKIAYIRSFKKGKGAILYFIAIPLYWIGHVYAGQDLLNGFFGAIKKTAELVVVKYDISSIQALLDANILYAIAIGACFIMVTMNAFLFAASLVSQYIWNWGANFLFGCSRKEKLIIFGNNEQNYSIYQSEKARAKIIVDNVDDKEAIQFYMKNIAYTSVTSFEKYIEYAVSQCMKKKTETVVVINTGDDEKNIMLCRLFIKRILEMDEAQRTACFGLMKIFVFGEPRYEAIYEDIMGDSCGCISYINKYQKIAMDFIDQYPFARFMTEEHLDYQTALAKEGVDINALFVGFGKTNRQIFTTSIANNQFIEKNAAGDVVIKKVNYHLFDKEKPENNKNLNHNYNRYKNECVDIDQENYLPLPDDPATVIPHKRNINEMEFYNEVRAIITKNANSVNYFVIAFGADLENIDLAQKLSFKCREWGVKNAYIFVKVRGEHKGQGLLEEDNCYIIANEKEVVYNVDKLLGDNIFKMAQMRNEVYELEYEITSAGGENLTENKVREIKANAYRNWYMAKTQLERDSSLYGCLSLRSKLNMLGLDYCPVSEKDHAEVSAEAYMDIYAKGDMPNSTYYNVTADGKPIVHYTLEFPSSTRKNLAIHEHLRWNSFMLTKGMFPATKQCILEETKLNDKGKVVFTNGKNYKLRRHGNITTFEGLEEFRKMVALRDQKPNESLEHAELRKDVIKYDYQLLDDAYWLLSRNGYKMVKKTKVISPFLKKSK